MNQKYLGHFQYQISYGSFVSNHSWPPCDCLLALGINCQRFLGKSNKFCQILMQLVFFARFYLQFLYFNRHSACYYVDIASRPAVQVWFLAFYWFMMLIYGLWYPYNRPPWYLIQLLSKHYALNLLLSLSSHISTMAQKLYMESFWTNHWDAVCSNVWRLWHRLLARQLFVLGAADEHFISWFTMESCG